MDEEKKTSLTIYEGVDLESGDPTIVIEIETHSETEAKLLEEGDFAKKEENTYVKVYPFTIMKLKEQGSGRVVQSICF